MRMVQTMNPIFYDRLDEVLEEKKIKNKTICKDLGISKSALYSWRTDGMPMNTVSYFRLCEYLNVSPAWLYGATDVKGEYAS